MSGDFFIFVLIASGENVSKKQGKSGEIVLTNGMEIGIIIKHSALADEQCGIV